MNGKKLIWRTTCSTLFSLLQDCIVYNFALPPVPRLFGSLSRGRLFDFMSDILDDKKIFFINATGYKDMLHYYRLILSFTFS